MAPTNPSRNGFDPNRLVIKWKTSEVEDRMSAALVLNLGELSEVEAQRAMTAVLRILADRGIDATVELGEDDGSGGITDETKQAIAKHLASVLAGSD